MAHFSVWQRSPFRNNFMPSRRHNRQTGPLYLAMLYLFAHNAEKRCALSNLSPRLARNFKVQFTARFRATSSRFLTPSNRFQGSRLRIHQTLRRFGGRQPLCGIGVRSLIDFTSIPTVASARTADSRPAPGPLTRTSTERSPYSLALLAAVSEACCAANGVPLREPRNPSEPELDQARTLPTRSVNVTMVLLNEAWTCTKPTDTTFFSFFLKVFFFVFFAGAFEAAAFSIRCP